MIGVAIGIALFPRHNDNPDFDRRVSGLHFLEIANCALGVGPGVIARKGALVLMSNSQVP